MIFFFLFVIFTSMILRTYVLSHFHIYADLRICPAKTLVDQYEFFFYLKLSNSTSEFDCWNGISLPLAILQTVCTFSATFSDFNWDMYILVHAYTIWELFYSFSSALQKDMQTRMPIETGENFDLNSAWKCYNQKSVSGIKRVGIRPGKLTWLKVKSEYEKLKDICAQFNNISGKALACYLSLTVMYYATRLSNIVANRDCLLAVSFSIAITAHILCADIVERVRMHMGPLIKFV